MCWWRRRLLLQAVGLDRRETKAFDERGKNLDQALEAARRLFRKTFHDVTGRGLLNLCFRARSKGRWKVTLTPMLPAPNIRYCRGGEWRSQDWECFNSTRKTSEFFRKREQHRGKVTSTFQVGLHVSHVDAQKVYPRMPSLQYQAVSVFAGSWPDVPYPTLSPGGPGSLLPTIAARGAVNLYYLELAAEGQLKRKVADLRDLVEGTRRRLQFDYGGGHNIS